MVNTVEKSQFTLSPDNTILCCITKQCTDVCSNTRFPRWGTGARILLGHPGRVWKALQTQHLCQTNHLCVVMPHLIRCLRLRHKTLPLGSRGQSVSIPKIPTVESWGKGTARTGEGSDTGAFDVSRFHTWLQAFLVTFLDGIALMEKVMLAS